jgi:hypothetical protein
MIRFQQPSGYLCQNTESHLLLDLLVLEDGPWQRQLWRSLPCGDRSIAGQLRGMGSCNLLQLNVIAPFFFQRGR